jgi:uncharacterized protein
MQSDMGLTELALTFPCAGEQLFGVLSLPAQPAAVGIVLIVGGPQYRVGSHRQFVRLARALAQKGFAVLRFDYRGMGDSSGPMRDFENVDDDIRAAANTLRAQCPEVTRIVLWGLCDAASAACMYAARDERVSGLVLLNPWVREAQNYARTQVKHYYGARLLQGAFWRKLLRGEVRLWLAAKDSLATLWRSFFGRGASTAGNRAPFQLRMLQGLRAFPGPVLLLLSGRDLTAREFCDTAAAQSEWRATLQEARVRRVDFPEADHTFSSRPWKSSVEAHCLQWLLELSSTPAHGADTRE